MKFPGVAALVLLLSLTGCASMQRADAHFQGTTLAIAQAPDFTLTSDSGHPWTLSNRNGKNVALFFGYTHCPDTCPLQMSMIDQALRKLPAESESQFQVVFVTTDPARDTPGVIRAWLDHFDKRFIGLT